MRCEVREDQSADLCKSRVRVPPLQLTDDAKETGGILKLASALHENWKLRRLDLRYNDLKGSEVEAKLLAAERMKKRTSEPLELLL